MREINHLQRLSLLLVLTGLTAIYGASHLFSPEMSDIDDIAEDDLGASMRVSGVVKDLSTTDNAIFFTLTGESGSIRAVSFDTSQEFAAGTTYTFDGRVDVYNGDLEFIVENVVSSG